MKPGGARTGRGLRKASIGSPPHPLDPLPTLRGEGDAPTPSMGSFVVSHLAFATFFAVIATALGRRLAALAGPAARTERWGLPLALGLGAIGCAMSLLAAAGRLTAPWLVVLLAAAAGAAAPEWRRPQGAAGAAAARPRRPIA